MKLKRVLLGTLAVLTGNKLRSGLTILGIVIGVAAVIAMLSIGQGAQNSITSSISSIGTNLLFVSAGGGARFGGESGPVFIRNVRELTVADAQAMMDPFQSRRPRPCCRTAASLLQPMDKPPRPASWA
jgi:putative ABC transport system permease protein